MNIWLPMMPVAAASFEQALHRVLWEPCTWWRRLQHRNGPAQQQCLHQFDLRVWLCTAVVVGLGGIGGLFYWLTIFPVDVIKSTMQTDDINPAKRKFPNMASTAKVPPPPHTPHHHHGQRVWACAKDRLFHSLPQLRLCPHCGKCFVLIIPQYPVDLRFGKNFRCKVVHLVLHEMQQMLEVDDSPQQALHEIVETVSPLVPLSVQTSVDAACSRKNHNWEDTSMPRTLRHTTQCISLLVQERLAETAAERVAPVCLGSNFGRREGWGGSTRASPPPSSAPCLPTESCWCTPSLSTAQLNILMHQHYRNCSPSRLLHRAHK